MNVGGESLAVSAARWRRYPAADRPRHHHQRALAAVDRSRGKLGVMAEKRRKFDPERLTRTWDQPDHPLKRDNKELGMELHGPVGEVAVADSAQVVGAISDFRTEHGISHRVSGRALGGSLTWTRTPVRSLSPLPRGRSADSRSVRSGDGDLRVTGRVAVGHRSPPVPAADAFALGDGGATPRCCPRKSAGSAMSTSARAWSARLMRVVRSPTSVRTYPPAGDVPGAKSPAGLTAVHCRPDALIVSSAVRCPSENGRYSAGNRPCRRPGPRMHRAAARRCPPRPAGQPPRSADRSPTRLTRTGRRLSGQPQRAPRLRSRRRDSTRPVPPLADR